MIKYFVYLDPNDDKNHMQYLLCHSFQCYTFARFKFIDSNCFYVNLIKPRLGRILGIPLVHPSVPNIFSFSILNKVLMDHFMRLVNNFENWDVFNPQTFIYSAFNLICCSSKWPAKVFWKVATWKGITLRIVVANWRIFIQDILIIRPFERSKLGLKGPKLWGRTVQPHKFWLYKVGCIFPMVVVSMLTHAEFGPNDHREDASYFIAKLIT